MTTNTQNKLDRTIMILLTIILSCAFFILFASAYKNVVTQHVYDDMHNTFSLCSKAQVENSGASEQACADAQDRTHTEFVCSNASDCWLEIK